MNSPDAVQRITLAVLSEALHVPVAQLVTEPVLATHDWDSLASLFSLAQLESEFGVALDLRSFHAARTVGDLVALITAASTSTVSR